MKCFNSYKDLEKINLRKKYFEFFFFFLVMLEISNMAAFSKFKLSFSSKGQTKR